MNNEKRKKKLDVCVQNGKLKFYRKEMNKKFSLIHQVKHRNDDCRNTFMLRADMDFLKKRFSSSHQQHPWRKMHWNARMCMFSLEN